MSEQVELFTEAQLRPPVYALPIFIEIRARAARKSNAFKATSRLVIGEERLLDAVRKSDGAFVSIALCFDGEVGHCDVFRDLLRARCKGLVRDIGGDRWEVVEP